MSVYKVPYYCHAGLDPASRRFRKIWIPAFAGMTILIEAAIYKQTLIKEKFGKRGLRMEIKKMGVVGAGQMGSGIAEVALVSGLNVLMRDVTIEALGKGRTRIVTDLERQVQKGKLGAEEKEAILGRLSTTTKIEDFADV